MEILLVVVVVVVVVVEIVSLKDRFVPSFLRTLQEDCMIET
jgi:hypothetical protein